MPSRGSRYGVPWRTRGMFTTHLSLQCRTWSKLWLAIHSKPIPRTYSFRAGSKSVALRAVPKSRRIFNPHTPHRWLVFPLWLPLRRRGNGTKGFCAVRWQRCRWQRASQTLARRRLSSPRKWHDNSWSGSMNNDAHNLSIDTDPQQQKAASPLMLVVRSFLRYVSWQRAGLN
jgi:hypothetical protein